MTTRTPEKGRGPQGAQGATPSAGKGDKPRPVDRRRYERNYDAIRWRSHEMKRQDEDRLQEIYCGTALAELARMWCFERRKRKNGNGKDGAA